MVQGQPVFVYGTLKRGMANHAWLQRERFLSEAALPGAWLYDLGPFPMAVLAPSPGAEAAVRGEVFAVSAAALDALDRLEGAPRLFERHWLELSTGEPAWVYLGRSHQVRHSPRITSGCWQRPGRAERWTA
ncbi:gamma-glutamylcyclotransferase [Cyanobium sp. NIES-981]|uniref:gamma-glutamylcyclotransferase family protein n=1 Tax=Cyanobium sp. NIES-981 TaxID=1851505 RepID=UPI001CEDB814|nr:gamma-glutamylcyclotransferase family protein [Cyanobium sp. NIES-981]